MPNKRNAMGNIRRTTNRTGDKRVQQEEIAQMQDRAGRRRPATKTKEVGHVVAEVTEEITDISSCNESEEDERAFSSLRHEIANNSIHFTPSQESSVHDTVGEHTISQATNCSNNRRKYIEVSCLPQWILGADFEDQLHNIWSSFSALALDPGSPRKHSIALVGTPRYPEAKQIAFVSNDLLVSNRPSYASKVVRSFSHENTQTRMTWPIDADNFKMLPVTQENLPKPVLSQLHLPYRAHYHYKKKNEKKKSNKKETVEIHNWSGEYFWDLLSDIDDSFTSNSLSSSASKKLSSSSSTKSSRAPSPLRSPEKKDVQKKPVNTSS
ncbi:Hypothetical predicted protein [Mytilus galloprovincialis]|uniref:Uncharacterized protein n=1 Tax=Mytilus galloprovincialis TaxID=29158 RepID=A0A8B6DKT7_MYTGA|nr:Hypothetical predicted protein [Mytilus galloprovincialis]